MNPGETIEQIADGVWVGIPGPLEGSMGAVVGETGGLVIDSTSYNLWAAHFLRRVAEQTGGPRWRFLYITHRHFDHFGGADAVDAPVLGHRLTREAMAGYDQGWLDRNIADWTEKDMVVPELLSEPTLVLPEVLFEHELEVSLGDKRVRFLHVGGHCADQTVVWLPDERVLFGSDNVFNGKPAFTGHGDLVTWIDCLKRLKELGPEIVVPGHGEVGGPELLQAQIDELAPQLARDLAGAT